MPTLSFKGKSFIQTHHMTVDYHTLLPDPAQSLTAPPSLDDNLIIHGDNLLALKALVPQFGGAVKCIYIDPPYNTGNEHWTYNDNVNSPLHRAWLGHEVGADDLTRHDKWCCLMWPRLRLLHELLRDDGAIFISIDDNEQHHLRLMLDEIFGAENFVTIIVWQKVFSPKNSAQFFSEDHEYILVYAKNSEVWRPNLLARTDEMDQRYDNPDADPRGDWASSDLSARNYYSKGTYSIQTPSGRVIAGPPTGSYWRVSEDRFQELVADNRIWWGPNGDGMPRLKRFLSEVKQGIVPQTLWKYSDVGHTQDAKKELLAIMQFDESADVFITPKPTTLIQRILQIATDPASDDLVLDSFAGSGTTGQAVLAQNRADGGSRRFILIEQEDYASTLTAERVRRVIAGVPASRDPALQAGYGGTFSYIELGAALNALGMLSGAALPSFTAMARHVFFTATGQHLAAGELDPSQPFIGSTARHDVYLLYQPDLAYLKATGLTLDLAEKLPYRGRTRLVAAAQKFLDSDWLDDLKIEFYRLPFALTQPRR